MWLAVTCLKIVARDSDIDFGEYSETAVAKMSGHNLRKLITDTENLLCVRFSLMSYLRCREKELMLDEETQMLKQSKNPEFQKEINEVKKKYDRATWDTNFKGMWL
jgi:hypothetical protein